VDLVVETLAATAPRLALLDPDDLEEALSLFPFLEREGDVASRLPIIRLKVLELLLLLGADRGGGRDPAAEAKPRFRAAQLMAYIEERYAESFSLDDLAARFALNPSYLSRAFKADSGYTIVEYVNKVRIQRSCVLLKRSSASILDIALAVGYNSLSHFNHYFRRITGSSPREFRSRSRK
jgi:AraC-like DNA-binding protein